MPDVYATEFAGIPFALANDVALRDRVLHLIAAEPIAAKAAQGSERLAAFREVLAAVARGELTTAAGARDVKVRLPRALSVHAASNRTFPTRWAERLLNTELSRFYNEAVLDTVLAAGSQLVYMSHSSTEQQSSRCSREIVGHTHDAREMRARLLASHGDDDWSSVGPKIPEHPQCSHVVTPFE